MKKEVYTQAEWKKIEKLAGQKSVKFTDKQARVFLREIGNLRFKIKDLEEEIESMAGVDK